MKQLQIWDRETLAGRPVPLPNTADVWMRPGKNHEGWWSSDEFWMQCRLAIAIFDYVFSSEPRFKLVAGLDWSQGHAAMAADGLDAENMLVRPGGISASHIRATSTPPPRMRVETVNGRRMPVFPKPWPKRAPMCISCVSSPHGLGVPCREASAEHMDDPNFQTIGVKGLKQVLEERNVPTAGKVQDELVELLQEFPDFAKRNLITRAYVTEIFKAAGHVALFGVKYHADLAHVERMWMFVKAEIRPYLTGVYPACAECRCTGWALWALQLTIRVLAGAYKECKRLVQEAYCKYSVHSARRNARHCRELMRAYLHIATHTNETSMASLSALAHEYKSHRFCMHACINCHCR